MNKKAYSRIVAFAFLIPLLSITVNAQNGKSRVFVHAEDVAQKRALMAIIAAADLRHEFVSPGNKLLFSAEITVGQMRAIEHLGGRIESVPRVFPVTQKRRNGKLQEIVVPQGKPVCGDGICKGNETAISCPSDCGVTPPEPPQPPERVCAPQDQYEYQTLLLSGGMGDRSGVKLLVIDTGVNKDHPDLNVTFCRDVTGPKIRNRCNDQIGHGTHVAGSAAANGGADGLGLFGTAPNAELGFEKICTTLCWQDDLIKGIEDGVQNFQPNVISLSFGSSNTASLKNAIDFAEDSGALFFAAAGNSGPGPNTISYPAAYGNVVAVGMLDAAMIASRMSSRGVDDSDYSVISPREVELAGGGFVIESTSMDGCYEIMSGTSMATPSVAGFAAANWDAHGGREGTRQFLKDVAQDINNNWGLLIGYDDTAAGFDTSTGYGMPQFSGTIAIAATVTMDVGSTTVAPGGEVTFDVEGPPDSIYRVGITSPSGNWTYGEFETDGSSNSTLSFTPWTDPGTWLITVDFGDSTTPNSFWVGYATFSQTN